MQQMIETDRAEQPRQADLGSTNQPDKPALSGVLSTLLCACLFMTLAACESEDVSDLHSYVKEIKARKKGRIPERRAQGVQQSGC